MAWMVRVFLFSVLALGAAGRASAQGDPRTAVDDVLSEEMEAERPRAAGEQVRFAMTGFNTTQGRGRGGAIMLELPLFRPSRSLVGSFGVALDGGLGVVGLSVNDSSLYAIGNTTVTWRSSLGPLTFGVRTGASFSYEVQVLTDLAFRGAENQSRMDVNRELVVRYLSALNVALRLAGNVHLFAEGQQLVGRHGHYLFAAGLAF